MGTYDIAQNNATSTVDPTYGTTTVVDDNNNDVAYGAPDVVSIPPTYDIAQNNATSTVDPTYHDVGVQPLAYEEQVIPPTYDMGVGGETTTSDIAVNTKVFNVDAVSSDEEEFLEFEAVEEAVEETVAYGAPDALSDAPAYAITGVTNEATIDNRVDPIPGGSRPSWLHSSMSRKKAKRLLTENGVVEGTWLVRERGDGSFALSVVHAGDVYHNLLVCDEDGIWTFNGHHCSGCSSLSEVVTKFQVPQHDCHWEVTLGVAVVEHSDDFEL